MGYKAKREVTMINFVNGRQDMKTSTVYHEMNCKKCGCDTRSHEYSDGTVMCHKCWLVEEEKKKVAEQPITPPPQETPEKGTPVESEMPKLSTAEHRMGDDPNSQTGPETVGEINDDFLHPKCPRCGSANFHTYYDNQVDGKATGEECDDCGHKAGDI